MSDTSFDDTAAMRPIVPTGRQGDFGMYAFFAVLMIGGIWLFATLSSARQDALAPATFPTSGGAARISAPAPLALPEAGRVLPSDLGPTEPSDSARAPLPPPAPVSSSAAPAALPPAPFYFPPQTPAPLLSQPRVPTVVFDRENAPQSRLAPRTEDDTNRVTATRLASPGFTVSQGTIIPAVLETAFDSTRPGRVRALVQRDIHSFDGTRVLVPRGSRLFGEYAAGLNPGERRALITWTRLLRPDGVSIALDSPASDPLGRGGVAGDVDSRFFARFGEALLQSVLDIGVGVAVGEATGNGGTILALPGSTQNVTQGGGSQGARPVLRIDHGTSVSVYVARDLDFSTVDR